MHRSRNLTVSEYFVVSSYHGAAQARTITGSELAVFWACFAHSPVSHCAAGGARHADWTYDMAW